MKNEGIAHIFRSIAQILEIKDENIFKIRAYYHAAESISGIDNLEELAAAEGLTEIPGIGKDLASKITEYLSSGKIEHFEKLRKEIPQGVLELLEIPSLGPKKVKLFYNTLKIKDIDSLEQCAKEGTLLQLEGIKEKTVENILKGIALARKGKQRFDIATAWSIAAYYVGELQKMAEVKEISVAGSLRRMKDTVKDIDILVISAKPKKVMDAFCSLSRVKEVIAKGETKSAIISQEGIQVDVRVVASRSFGAALLYFTGSKNHNVKMRTMAVRQGLKINEYGVLRGERCVASKTEEEIYHLLGMRYIAPELREDSGEIELALQNKLPLLIEEKDIKGDFHVHSSYSDGVDSIEAMARECKKRGYEYVVIADHSQSLRVAGGLLPKELRKKKKEIERLNRSMKNFRILFGTEVEINTKGDIDYDDAILKEFDIVVAAIHSGFKQSKEQLTLRLVRAMRNPYVDIIAHPTARLRGRREPFNLDFEAIFAAAAESHTCLEINAFPDRLDLNDAHIRAARAKGVVFAIGSDSHRLSHLEFMRFGVALARRGGLEAKDVLNVLPLKNIVQLKKKNL